MSLLPRELPTTVRWRDQFGIVNELALQVVSSVANHTEFGNQMFTGETPYKGLNVLVLGSNALRGQRATILSMHADPKYKSGLGVRVQLDIVQGVATQDTEYDYNDIRRVDSHRFIHDLAPTAGMHEPIIWLPPGINSYYNFKLGYREFGFIPTVEPVMGPPLPPSEPHEPSPLPSINGIPGSTPAWMREEHDELRLGGVAWNLYSSGYWFANTQLWVSLAGKDVKIATVRGIDERVQIYTTDGGVVIREVSMAFNKREYGRNLDPSEISMERTKIAKNLLVIAITDKQKKQGQNLVKGLQALDYNCRIDLVDVVEIRS
ncbi:hypothetical protein BT96DRAFT_937406 [Gymnopus androsaceus JB14]|uniref:Uncharacterized protein n=1 Tax=Gymnopus androsaceus JB14 TaxID=1447944 RepID=A0A6A4HW49_9AGAR|nr:hypothetical protein BT96DRAFT_937406 [Gymnopus androsaceus JB14]